MLRAPNGAEAIAVAQKYGEQIDLLMTDVVMPGMNGAELATNWSEPPGDEGPVNLGVHRERHRPPRHRRGTPGLHREAVHPVGAGKEGSGRTRQGMIVRPLVFRLNRPKGSGSVFRSVSPPAPLYDSSRGST